MTGDPFKQQQKQGPQIKFFESRKWKRKSSTRHGEKEIPSQRHGRQTSVSQVKWKW